MGINLPDEMSQLPDLFLYVIDTKLKIKVGFIKVNGRQLLDNKLIKFQWEQLQLVNNYKFPSPFV